MVRQKGFATLLALGLIFGALAGGTLIGKYMKPDSIPEEAIEAYLKTQGIDCEFSPDQEQNRSND